MSGIHIVIPMAGLGKRFADAGEIDPKPFIDVLGQPMYSRALECLPLQLAKSITLICLRAHETRLQRDVTARYPTLPVRIVPLDVPTRGQACTVLAARTATTVSEPLLVFNVDTALQSTLVLELQRRRDADGFITVFEAPGSHWSFARVGDDDRILETAEKKRISPWATAGLYHFAHGRDFYDAAEETIRLDQTTRGEFYVAPIYNSLIQRGANIYADYAAWVRPMGTPEELRASIADGFAPGSRREKSRTVP